MLIDRNPAGCAGNAIAPVVLAEEVVVPPNATPDREPVGVACPTVNVENVAFPGWSISQIGVPAALLPIISALPATFPVGLKTIPLSGIPVKVN